MKQDEVFTETAADPIKASYRSADFGLVFRSLIIFTIVLFCVETTIMVLFEAVLHLPQQVVLVLDGALLVMLLLPLNYWFIVRPMSQEIFEHHRTIQDLSRSNKILESFFSVNDLLIAFMDAKFNFVRVNQAYAAADQRPADEFIGKNHFDLFPNAENQKIFEEVIKTGKGYTTLERPFTYEDHPERGITYWDWSLLPIKNAAGTVIGLLFVLSDVTDRKQAQLAQIEIERRFKAVFNQTFQHIGLLDPSGESRIFNQTALDFTGLSQSDIERIPLWQLPWWESNHTGAEWLRSAVLQAASGNTIQGEQCIHSANGDLATMEITIKPFLDETGQPVMLIYEARDISRHIKAEEALRKSEEEIKRLYHAEIKAHTLAETLREAGVALSGSLNSDTVLTTLLNHLHKVVPYDSAHIYLFDDEDHLAVRIARGGDRQTCTQCLLGKKFDISDFRFLDPILENHQIVSIPDTTAYPNTPFFEKCTCLRSWLGIPLLARGKMIGLCSLEHQESNFFNESHIHWADALTSQAVVAIQNAWLFEQVRDGRERLQALSHRLVEVQESERHHIAQELHDEAGQALTTLLVGLRLVEQERFDADAVLTRSQELKQIANDVLENLHRLAIDLRPAALDHLGLVPALRQHIQTVSEQHSIAVRFETVGAIERMPGDMETAIYRIVQEALTNAVRHAQASRVDVLLERRGQNLLVIIEDDGIGFNPEIPKVGQLGMMGMRERADMLGGSFTVESTPRNGTTILLEVPCPSAS